MDKELDYDSPTLFVALASLSLHKNNLLQFIPHASGGVICQKTKSDHFTVKPNNMFLLPHGIRVEVLKLVPTGQIWDNWSIEINNDRDGL